MIKKVKLGDICEVRGGYAFKSIDFQKQGIPVIRISNISDNSVLLDDKTVFVDSVSQDMLQKYSIHKGDILVALSGATTGKFGIYEEDTEALLNQRVAKLIPSNLINNLYLYYYLNTLRSIILQRAMGVAQPNISPKEIEDMIIFLPLLETQIKIAQILDQAQRLIDKRKEQIALLDGLIQSMFYDMFGDPIINDRTWNLEKLKNLGTLKRGKSSHRPRNAPELLNGQYPLIQTGDIANAGLYLNDYTTTYSELGLKQSKLWSKGTLCITIAANIAKTTIITFDACFPDSVVAFLNKENIVNKMYIQIWMSFLQKIIEDSAPESAQKNINLKILGELDVILPPIELQSEFAERVEDIEKQKELLNKSLAELETNFHSLMQRAFRGELVVE